MKARWYVLLGALATAVAFTPWAHDLIVWRQLVEDNGLGQPYVEKTSLEVVLLIIGPILLIMGLWNGIQELRQPRLELEARVAELERKIAWKSWTGAVSSAPREDPNPDTLRDP